MGASPSGHLQNTEVKSVRMETSRGQFTIPLSTSLSLAGCVESVDIGMEPYYWEQRELEDVEVHPRMAIAAFKTQGSFTASYHTVQQGGSHDAEQCAIPRSLHHMTTGTAGAVLSFFL